MKSWNKRIALLMVVLFTIGTNWSAVFALDNDGAKVNKDVSRVIAEAYSNRANAVLMSAATDSLDNYYKMDKAIYKFEKERFKKYKLMEKKLNLKIVDMKTTANVFEINIINNNQVEAYVYEWIFFDWADENEYINVSGLGVTHKVTLINSQNKWVIQSDEYEEGPLTDVTSPDYKEIKPKEDKNNQKDNTSDIIATVVPDATYYNHNAAANYSDNWVYNNAAGGAVYENYYNNAQYKNFNPSGGDCANFVSQSMYAGNAYFVGAYTNTSSNWWYNNKGTSSTSDDVASTTWTYCPSQRAFLLNYWGTATTSSNLLRGDVVYYDWTSDGSWNHATMVAAFDSTLKPLVNSHNNDYYHVRWNYGSSSCSYSTIHISDYI